MDTVKKAGSGQIPSLNSHFRDDSTNIYGYFSLSVKINLSLLSQQIPFLCVSRVNFLYFEILALLSR